jgi:hypothetical protein
MTVDTITINDTIRARIEHDTDVQAPDWETLGSIAYNSRYTLGTEGVSQDRLDSIALGIKNGSLVGLPVYAYVHSGSMISCGTPLKNGTIVFGNPFHCPWDSGQSGFVYASKERVVKEYGKKILTAGIKQKALQVLAKEVECFSQYLEGDVYGVIVERLTDGEWVEEESCWGLYGLDYAREEANRMGEHEATYTLEGVGA